MIFIFSFLLKKKTIILHFEVNINLVGNCPFYKF